MTRLTTYNSTAHQCVLRAQLGNSTLKTASHFSSPPPLYNFFFFPLMCCLCRWFYSLGYMCWLSWEKEGRSRCSQKFLFPLFEMDTQVPASQTERNKPPEVLEKCESLLAQKCTHTHINRNWHQLNELPCLPTFLVKESIWKPLLSTGKVRQRASRKGKIILRVSLIYEVYLYSLSFIRKPCKWCLYALNCDNWTDELKTWLNI